MISVYVICKDTGEYKTSLLRLFIYKKSIKADLCYVLFILLQIYE